MDANLILQQDLTRMFKSICPMLERLRQFLILVLTNLGTGVILYLTFVRARYDFPLDILIWPIRLASLIILAVVLCKNITLIGRAWLIWRAEWRGAIDHGQTLDEVIETLRKEICEYNVLFDLDGRKLSETTSFRPDHVNWSDEQVQRMTVSAATLIELHNHPGGNDAFSPQDICLAARYRPYMSLLVVEDYLYVMCFTEAADEYSKELEHNIAEAHDYYYWQYRNGQDPWAQWLRPKELHREATTYACKKIAPIFHFNFFIKPLQ